MVEIFLDSDNGYKNPYVKIDLQKKVALDLLTVNACDISEEQVKKDLEKIINKRIEKYCTKIIENQHGFIF